MQYMVIEKYRAGCAAKIYERVRVEGRQLPDGLSFLDSWVDARLETCFQLMETDDVSLLDLWIRQWDDLADFEVFPVMTSDQARRAAKELQ